MLKSICIIMATVLITHSVSARIFETQVQCVNRYGKSLEGPKMKPEGVTKKTFTKNEMLIFASFRDQKVVTITFQRQIQPGKSWSLTDEEVRSLLAANGGDAKWIGPTTEVSLIGNKNWKTEDGKLTARLENGMVLKIQDSSEPDRIKLDEAAAKKKDQKDLSKF